MYQWNGMRINSNVKMEFVLFVVNPVQLKECWRLIMTTKQVRFGIFFVVDVIQDSGISKTIQFY